MLRSKLPPSCGVVSAATLVIPVLSDPVSTVRLNVLPFPCVKVIILFVAEAVVIKLAVAAFTEPDISLPI